LWTSSAETSRVTEPLGSGVSVLSIVPAALIIAIGAFLAFSIAVGTLVIVIVANRAEPDRSGWRPWSVYFFGMSFISVFVTLFGTFAIVLGLVQLIGTHPGSGLGFPSSVAAHPIGDAVTRVVVMSALITVAGAVLLATHIRRGLALPEWRRGEHGPINRVAQSYVGAVCFVSLVIAASAFVSAGYQLFRVIAPGIFELSGPRVDAVRVLLASLYLMIASIFVAVMHAQIPPGGFFKFAGVRSGRGGGPHLPQGVGFDPHGMPPPSAQQHAPAQGHGAAHQQQHAPQEHAPGEQRMPTNLPAPPPPPPPRQSPPPPPT
jgi:hypothetical protein